MKKHIKILFLNAEELSILNKLLIDKSRAQISNTTKEVIKSIKNKLCK
jgi:hypothetical protein